MTDQEFEYLKLQYEEASKAIKNWVESRYKILQFIGYYNGAILTLGFSQKLILSSENTESGIALCILSFLVALMGLATENSNRRYNVSYFEVLRDIELKMNGKKKNKILDKVGTYSWGYECAKNTFINKILNLDRAHKTFYFVLSIFWLALLIINIISCFLN